MRANDSRGRGGPTTGSGLRVNPPSKRGAGEWRARQQAKDSLNRLRCWDVRQSPHPQDARDSRPWALRRVLGSQNAPPASLRAAACADPAARPAGRPATPRHALAARDRPGRRRWQRGNLQVECQCMQTDDAGRGGGGGPRRAVLGTVRRTTGAAATAADAATTSRAPPTHRRSTAQPSSEAAAGQVSPLRLHAGCHARAVLCWLRQRRHP